MNMRIWTSRSSTASRTRALALVLSVLLVAMLLAPAGIAFAENGQVQPEIRDECPAPCAGGLVLENPDFQEQSYDIPGYPGKRVLVVVGEGDGAWVRIESEVGVTRVSLAQGGDGDSSCSVYDFADDPVFQYNAMHTQNWELPVRIEICFAEQDEGTPEPEPEPEAQPTPQPAPEPEAEAQVVVLPRTGGDGLVLLGAAAIFGSGGVAIRTLSRRRKH